MSVNPSLLLKMTCFLRATTDVTTATVVITMIIKSCYHYYQWCKNIYFHQKNTTNLQEESTIKLENMVSGPPSVETSHWGYWGALIFIVYSPRRLTCGLLQKCMKVYKNFMPLLFYDGKKVQSSSMVVVAVYDE